MLEVSYSVLLPQTEEPTYFSDVDVVLNIPLNIARIPFTIVLRKKKNDCTLFPSFY